MVQIHIIRNSLSSSKKLEGSKVGEDQRMFIQGEIVVEWRPVNQYNVENPEIRKAMNEENRNRSKQNNIKRNEQIRM